MQFNNKGTAIADAKVDINKYWLSLGWNSKAIVETPAPIIPPNNDEKAQNKMKCKIVFNFLLKKRSLFIKKIAISSNFLFS